MSLTKLALKRPVSVILIVIALAVFGISAVTGFKMQLLPDMDMPMLIVMTTYVGADPESVEKLVTDVVEDAGAVLSGVDTITSQSSENVSMVMFRYEYGVDIDECYTDMRAALDTASLSMPDGAGTPVVMELDVSSIADMTLSVSADGDIDLKKTLEEGLVPELESIYDVAQVEVSGGTEDYIRILLKEDMLKQYGLTMAMVSGYLSSMDFTVPMGSIVQGSQDVSVSASMEYNTVRLLEQVPIMTSTGSVVYLTDIADISMAKEKADTISKSNGIENISISVQKVQSASVVQIADEVMEVIEEYMQNNPQIHIDVEYNAADSITTSLWSVAQTLIIGVVISMLVLFLFFGDVKASLIVGSSMPISILATLILMNMMGFSLNVISLGSLVIAIGMIVDNSIVVIESCFRASDTEGSIFEAALRGTKLVTMSIVASTITTIVVYLPLATMDDLVGQIFGQLGFTIVFAMLSSLVSAMTLVPLAYSLLKPKEKKEVFINRILAQINRGYRWILKKALHRKLTVILITLMLMVVSILMLRSLNMELMPSSDEGIVQVSASFRPGTTLEAKEKAVEKLEALAEAEEDVESYSVTISGSSSASMSAYLRDDREMSTADIIEKWNQETKNYTDMEFDISSGGSTRSRMMMTSSSVEIDLVGDDRDVLNQAAAQVQSVMEQVDGVIKVTSSANDTSTTAKVKIDPLMTMHYGMTPVQVAAGARNILSGTTVMTVTNDGTEYEVKLEYPEGLYDDMSSLMEATITNTQGVQVPLREIAQVVYTDEQQTITKSNGKYQVSLTAATTQAAQYTAQDDINAAVKLLNLPDGVEQAESSRTRMMRQELGAIVQAIFTAIFLVFLVMAMQFESPRFSLMVMMCIPFSLIGSFFMLYIADFTISMVSLMGFLMLVGIVVNNGILYVDTVNQLRQEIPLEEALMESGCIRLRPILMTTLTTILSMIPMAIGMGENSAMMQGMALVIIGGLVASTLLTLLLMPTIYLLIDKKEKKKGNEIQAVQP